MTTFVTGGTGFLGRYLIEGLIEAGEEVVTLVRGRDGEAARARQRSALAWLGEDVAQRSEALVTVCPGNLEAPGLGLSAGDREQVLSRCDSFLHCGSSVRFDLSLERARAVNVFGTREVLGLARERQRRGGRVRVDYLSTAYVAGRRADRVLETELVAPQGHKNTYERTKFEAEQLVRTVSDELPVTIFRPSIVVGEVGRGRTPTFTGFYTPVMIYALGLWRTVPGRPDCLLDFVPVDFVRDAIFEIRRRPESRGRCFHLAAGSKGAVTVREMVSVVESFFPDRRPVRFVDPDRWMRWIQPPLELLAIGRLKRVAPTVRFFAPYLTANPDFDTSQADALLAETPIRVPELRTYVQRLLHYGVATDWGRRPRPDASSQGRSRAGAS